MHAFRDPLCRSALYHTAAASVFVLLATSAAAQSFPVPPHIEAIGEKNNSRLLAGYLDTSLYDGWNGNPVDPTGTADSTAALQRALDDGYEYGLAVYLPAGTYLVSDTLRRDQIFSRSGCAEHLNYGTPNRIRKAPILVGPGSGPRPVIRLKDNSPGFGDPDRPQSVVHFRNLNVGSGETDWEGDADCGMDLVFRGINIEVGVGNPGAIGLQIASAQYSILEDVRVDASGGYAGVRGVPTTNAVVNLEVVGGRFGVIPQSATTFVGLTLRDQEETALVIDTWNTVTVVGFDIEIDRGPAIHIDRGGQTAQLALIDGAITIGDGADPAIENPKGKDLSLHNVYVQAPAVLVQSGSESPVAASSGWDRIEEYSYTNPVPGRTSAGDIDSHNMINGVIGQDEELSILADSTPPSTDFVASSIWKSVPSFEDPGVVNVLDVGVMGDGVTDDTAALQAAIDGHDAVFLPRGDYMLSDTLSLKENTQLFGVPGHRTRLYATSWDPRGSNMPMIRTHDSGEATTYIGDIHIVLPAGLSKAFLEAVDWRSGRHSWSRQVSVVLKWEEQTESHSRRVFRMRNNGGGRFYGLQLHTTAQSRTHHDDFRFLHINSTTEPLTLYGSNFEHVLGTHVEINGAANVRFLGMKTETMSHEFLRIVDSSNIMFAGHAGNGSIRNNESKFTIIDSTDILMPIASMYQSDTRFRGGFLLAEDFDGDVVSIDATSNCSLFRRGTFDPSPFATESIETECGDGRCEPGESCTSCVEDCGPCSEPRRISACLTASSVIADGDTSEWLETPSVSLPHSSVVSGSPPDSDADASAKISVMWDDEAFAVLIDVTDDAVVGDSDAPYLDDSIELYLDAGNEGAPTYDDNDFQITIAADNTRGGVQSEMLTLSHDASLTDDGYRVEIVVHWTDLGIAPTAETAFGFDVAINDDDDGGATRESQLVWSGDGTGWHDPRVFGDATLGSSDCADDAEQPDGGDGDSDDDAGGDSAADGDGDTDNGDLSGGFSCSASTSGARQPWLLMLIVLGTILRRPGQRERW